jgi:hypothetical protein
MYGEQYIDLATITRKISSAQGSFDLETRRERFDLSKSSLQEGKKDLFGYLPGFLVGDAAKRRSSPSSGMFLEVQLKKHKENERLGEFVGLCANAFGISYYKVNDRFVNERLPHGRYHWKSSPSPLVTWMFRKCLGLQDGQLTTYAPSR